MLSSAFGDDDKIPETPISWFSRNGYRDYDDPFTDLQHVITHIFPHPHLPPVFDDHKRSDLPLIRAVCIAAHAYQDHIDCASKPPWLPIVKMLDRLKTVILSQSEEEFCLTKKDIISWFEGMTTGDILVFPLRYQDTGIIFRKQEHHALYEPVDILERLPFDTRRKLSYSYPQLVVEIPNHVYDHKHFQSSFVDFLCDRTSSGDSGGVQVSLFSEKGLLNGILRSVGNLAEPVRITKHVRHHTPNPQKLRRSNEPPGWSRSSLWLLTRIAIQSSLDRSPLGRAVYKHFMLFFMFKLTHHAIDSNVSSDLLHSMSAKLLRRLRKLHSPPPWLSDAVLHTCSRLSAVLDNRWKDILAIDCSPIAFNPSQLNLTKDIQHTLLHTHEFIISTAMNHDHPQDNIPVPLLYIQPTLDDFLSSEGKFFEVAHLDNPSLTLRSVEHMVAQGIDNWVSSVANVDKACIQLKVLLNRCMSSMDSRDKRYLEYSSNFALTVIELWVAIDRLVTKEIPILIDYSPEIPLGLFSRVLLPNPMAIHRVCRLYRYLSGRHSRAFQGWSVISDEFTANSFPVRYFDSSASFRYLRDRIGKDILPSNPYHAKVVVFELQSPVSFQIWRSITCHLVNFSAKSPSMTVYSVVPELQLYYTRHPESNVHLACSGPQRWDGLHYTVMDDRRGSLSKLSFRNAAYQLPDGPYKGSQLQQYLSDTAHTSNEVLSAQERCHPDLPLHEFIAFGHLRSGGTLQWINILRELRNKNLNFRRYEVFLLLAQASSQVGPPSDTGDLLWHQDLFDPSYCHALLDELESLFADLSAGVSDGPGMAIISLLSRSLAAETSVDIVERVARLLRDVCQKTFDWVQDLLYDAIMSPLTENQDHQLLMDAAAICRSTFDAGSAVINRLLHSAQDIEIALSCAFIIHATMPANLSKLPAHSQLLLEQNSRLSVTLVEAIKEAIEGDESDLGIDLAIRRIWPGYQPGACRWEPFQNSGSHWLVSQTREARSKPSQTILIHLLDGSLLLDGKPVCTRLPDSIVYHSTYHQVFKKRNFIVNPSDLPGMDFSTRITSSGHYVHFSLRGDRLHIRAESDDGEILVLIPQDTVRHDLPPMLVEGHVHWLNVLTSVIEIRPFYRIWERSSDNLAIHRMSGDYYHITNGHQSLVDIRSATWETVSRPLRGLEFPANLIVTASPQDAASSSSLLPQLFVSLSRYGLSFFVNQAHELESDDFKNMVIDENQSTGTLVGLIHRLVLRPRDQIAGDLTPRRILIPRGEPYLQKDGSRISAMISDLEMPVEGDDVFTGDNFYPRWRMEYHSYEVDMELGCLTGIANQASRIYLARLHALTSSDCRSDPLTGRTGLEEAISLLWSTRQTQHGHLPPSHESRLSESTYRDDVEDLLGMGSPQICFSLGQESREPPIDAMLQEAYLFPSDVVARTPKPDSECDQNDPAPDRRQAPPGYDSDYLFYPKLSREDYAYIVAAAFWRWSFSLAENGTSTHSGYISNWVEAWGDSKSVFGAYTGYLEAETILEIKAELRNLFQGSKLPLAGDAWRFHLLFFLPRLLDTRASCSVGGHDVLLLLTLATFAKQPHFLSEKQPEPRWPRAAYTLLDTLPLHKSRSTDCTDSEDTRARDRRVAMVARRNLKLKEHLTSIFCGPRPHFIPDSPELALHWCSPELSPSWQTNLDKLLRERPAPELSLPNTRLHCHRPPRQVSLNSGLLHQFLASLRNNVMTPTFQGQYLSKLWDSANRAVYSGESTTTGITHGSREKPSTETLQEHYVRCRASYRKALDIVMEALGPETDFERILHKCGQWPRVTPYTLFQCLASTSPTNLSQNWRLCLIILAHLVLELQRARRLIHFSLNRLDEEFFKELENEVNERVVTACPDWLLMELQGNFMIRPIQVNIAEEMVSPRSQENTVMQVNMGEGKSSVIMPMCAAALAASDSNRLVRIIVPGVLAPQMLENLAGRLGGLVGRRIFHLAFDRRLDDIDRLLRLVSECKEERGVLIMQPEHVLSLRLACVEKQLLVKGEARTTTSVEIQNSKWGYNHLLTDLLWNQVNQGSYISQLLEGFHKTLNQKSRGALDSEENPGGRNEGSNKCPTLAESNKGSSLSSSESVKQELDRSQWRELAKFIDIHTRDILDESDEILQPRLQVVYAIGHQHHVDGSPARWVITQQILWLVAKHGFSLSSHKIKYETGPPGSFPHICILQADGGAELISRIVGDVMNGQLSHLSIPSPLRTSIRDFISCKDILPGMAKMVKDCALNSTTWDVLLLLRGLFANNILLFALAERRWRVDYGLHPARTLLAVPYRAKDLPTATAEFGHPDITILLTCLSYYYGGLTESQLRDSFEILLEQDDPSEEYSLWVADCASEQMPQSLRILSNIDIKSTEQWNAYIVPLFSLSQRAINFYLARVVFPKYAKEYPWKISCSSWDIAEKKNHLVTGFSGTNDAQYLLPVSITQRDPEELIQTGSNAVVLAYLLQPENASYSLTIDGHGERWTTAKLLSVLVSESPEIRVLLDVGAHILDLSNHQVAEAWLYIIPPDVASGVIYFDEDNELMVLARDGWSQSLSSSPLNHTLDQCVAYLDHAHTRGTDIRFPHGFRAAVTLGPKVTKDQLVQGCMRMRKLGHGHSVKFFIPPEVDHAIRLLAEKDEKTIINTADILRWTIHETWNDIQRRAYRWVQQSMQHASQHKVWTRFCHEEVTKEQLTESWLQPEARTLADLYEPSHSPNSIKSMILDRDIRDRCKYLGMSSLPDARLEEEQEREVSQEIEREREVERPPRASPTKHFLHPDVTNFVSNGTILPTSIAFRPIFTALDNTSAATGDAHAWSPYVLATADFCKTVIEDGSLEGRMDEYLRPVQWVLSGKMYGNDVLVVLSPFEVDQLMPDIRLSEHVYLHSYTPRTSKLMKPCDDLQLYPIPPLPPFWTPPWTLIDQLNIFAGQLYLRDFESYVRLSRFLGVHRKDLPSDARMLTKPNWLNMPGSFGQMIEETIEGNPLRFVKLLLAIRRRGMRFDDTHMGRLLQGWLLTEDDFPSFKPGLPSRTAPVPRSSPSCPRDSPNSRQAGLWNDQPKEKREP